MLGAWWLRRWSSFCYSSSRISLVSCSTAAYECIDCLVELLVRHVQCNSRCLIFVIKCVSLVIVPALRAAKYTSYLASWLQSGVRRPVHHTVTDIHPNARLPPTTTAAHRLLPPTRQNTNTSKRSPAPQKCSSCLRCTPTPPTIITQESRPCGPRTLELRARTHP